MIGHIKCVALLPGGGFLRGSKISVHYPPDMALHAGNVVPVAMLELSLNVLVYGLPLSEARHILRETALHLAQKWGAGLEIVQTGDSR